MNLTEQLVLITGGSRSCAEVGSVISAVIAGYRAFQQFAPRTYDDSMGMASRAGKIFSPSRLTDGRTAN